MSKPQKFCTIWCGMTQYCLLLFSDVIIQTNKLFIFRDLLNFTAKYIGGQIKALVFFFVSLRMRKVQKVESINIQSDCKTTSKKGTDSSCVFSGSGKVGKGGER